MAAILRFGAEELFRDGDGDAAADERHGKAIMEEDLDAILARAEVRRPLLPVRQLAGCALPRCRADWLAGWLAGWLAARNHARRAGSSRNWRRRAGLERARRTWWRSLWSAQHRARAGPNAIPPSASLTPPPLPPPRSIPSHHHHPAPATEQVVEDKGETQQAGRMGDLLGQFNVATFKTSEPAPRGAGPRRLLHLQPAAVRYRQARRCSTAL